MTAAAAASVAQFNQGETLANTSGTGVDQSSPNTDNTIGGTHSQCNSLLVGFAWLEPYSPSQSVTVRIGSSYARRFKEATAQRKSPALLQTPGSVQRDRFYDRVAVALPVMLPQPRSPSFPVV